MDLIIQSLALTNVMILQKHYIKRMEKVLNLVKQIMEMVGEDFLSATFIRLKDCLGAEFSWDMTFKTPCAIALCLKRLKVLRVERSTLLQYIFGSGADVNSLTNHVNKITEGMNNLHKMAANDKAILALELANAKKHVANSKKVEILQKSLQGFHWDSRKKQHISSMLQSSVFKHELDSQNIV